MMWGRQGVFQIRPLDHELRSKHDHSQPSAMVNVAISLSVNFAKVSSVGRFQLTRTAATLFFLFVIVVTLDSCTASMQCPCTASMQHRVHGYIRAVNKHGSTCPPEDSALVSFSRSTRSTRCEKWAGSVSADPVLAASLHNPTTTQSSPGHHSTLGSGRGSARTSALSATPLQGMAQLRPPSAFDFRQPQVLAYMVAAIRGLLVWHQTLRRSDRGPSVPYALLHGLASQGCPRVHHARRGDSEGHHRHEEGPLRSPAE